MHPRRRANPDRISSMSSLFCPNSLFLFCQFTALPGVACTQPLTVLKLELHSVALIPLWALGIVLLFISAWRGLSVFGRNSSGFAELFLLYSAAALWLTFFFAEHCLFPEGTALQAFSFFSCAALLLLCAALANMGLFLVCIRVFLRPYAVLRWGVLAGTLAVGLVLLVVGYTASAILFDVVLLLAVICGVCAFALGVAFFAFRRVALMVFAGLLWMIGMLLLANVIAAAFFADRICPVWKYWGIEEFVVLLFDMMVFGFSLYFGGVRRSIVGMRKVGEVDFDGQVFSVHIDPF